MAEETSYLYFSPVRQLQVGVGYSWMGKKVLPLAQVAAVEESLSRPQISFGLGTDRLGGDGRSGFVIASKNLTPFIRRPAGVYFGLAVRSTGKGVFALGGGTLNLVRNLDLTVQHDGSDFHPGLSVTMGMANLTLLAVRSESFGFNVGFGW